MKEKTERLILNSPNSVNLCIDFCDETKQQGRLYHQYRSGAVSFSSLFEAFDKMERFYDELEFPQASTEYRSFQRNRRTSDSRKIEPERLREVSQSRKKEMRKMETFDRIIGERGEHATFVVRVMYRQNSSWQGEVTWVEEQKKERFRSALELVRLLDSVLNTEKQDAEKENAG